MCSSDLEQRKRVRGDEEKTVRGEEEGEDGWSFKVTDLDTGSPAFQTPP